MILIHEDAMGGEMLSLYMGNDGGKQSELHI